MKSFLATQGGGAAGHLVRTVFRNAQAGCGELGEGHQGRRYPFELSGHLSFSDIAMDDVVYLRLSRPQPDLVARASRIAVSDLYEALPADLRDRALMNSRIRPLLPGIRVAGPAVTARCAPGDNLMMHKALLLAQGGDVLVVDAGEPSGAQWGYLAAVYANKKETSRRGGRGLHPRCRRPRRLSLRGMVQGNLTRSSH